MNLLEGLEMKVRLFERNHCQSFVVISMVVVDFDRLCGVCETCGVVEF